MEPLPIVRHGLLATCALAALVLLAFFYSIVSGAVDRAARHRLDVREGRATTATSPAATARAPAAVALLARSGS